MTHTVKLGRETVTYGSSRVWNLKSGKSTHVHVWSVTTNKTSVLSTHNHYSFNPLQPGFAHLYPLKTSENL